MQPRQFSLLEPGPAFPEGLKYQANWLPPEEERELVGQLAGLPFRAFEFQGYVGKRRVVSFGWQYDFNDMRIRRAEDIPSFLLPLRERAAAFANLPASELQHVLLTEYAPGAAIGWHKDKAVFGKVVGILFCPHACSACAKKLGAAGNVPRSSPSRGPPISCKASREPNGSIASRRWTACAIRSPSGIFIPTTSLGGSAIKSID
jgi:hypothetical protein